MVNSTGRKRFSPSSSPRPAARTGTRASRRGGADARRAGRRPRADHAVDRNRGRPRVSRGACGDPGRPRRRGRGRVRSGTRGGWLRGLLARRPEAYADHAARFFMGIGNRPQRALALAAKNWALRDTPRSRNLLSGPQRSRSHVCQRAGRMTLASRRFPRWLRSRVVGARSSRCDRALRVEGRAGHGGPESGGDSATLRARSASGSRAHVARRVAPRDGFRLGRAPGRCGPDRHRDLGDRAAPNRTARRLHAHGNSRARTRATRDRDASWRGRQRPCARHRCRRSLCPRNSRLGRICSCSARQRRGNGHILIARRLARRPAEHERPRAQGALLGFCSVVAVAIGGFWLLGGP